MKIFIKELFYPIKNTKIILLINVCFFLVVGLLSISSGVIDNLVSKNYDYFEDNVLYDEFKSDSSNIDSVLKENSLKYSNILNNNIINYTCTTNITLNVISEDKYRSYEFHFTNYFYLAYAINTKRSTNLAIISNEKGIYISNILYDKLNRPESLNVSMDYNKIVEIPICGVFLDDSEAYDRIYCSYDFIKKLKIMDIILSKVFIFLKMILMKLLMILFLNMNILKMIDWDICHFTKL